MKIDRELIQRMALLARIELSDREVEEMTRHLARILEYVRQVETVDTEGVEPMIGAVPLEATLREDVERPSLPSSDVFRNAPETTGSVFLVPRILGDVGAPAPEVEEP